MTEPVNTPADSAPAAPETEAPSNNTNDPAQATAPAQEAPKAPDLHGFTEDQLADMQKFFASQGGYEKLKYKLSNPSPKAPEQPAAQSEQPAQPAQAAQPEPQKATPPEGFASWQELMTERYFKDLAKDEKYAPIADKIESGEILKEMASMGMHPIDENYNVNVRQLQQFLDLKAASVPAKAPSVEITNTPTVDYVQVGENITSMNQALEVIQQSQAARAQGAQPHPAEEKAREYIRTNWGKK